MNHHHTSLLPTQPVAEKTTGMEVQPERLEQLNFRFATPQEEQQEQVSDAQNFSKLTQLDKA